MTFFGDDSNEMPRSRPFDDDAIDAILSGASPQGVADVAAFVSDVRAAGDVVPTPSFALAAALATGLSTEKGVPAMPARNVHGPTRWASGLPKWRALRMKIKGLVAGLGVAGKVALGATLAAAATTGAGAAGILPGPVQHVVASTVDAVTPLHFDDGGGSTGAAPEPTTTTTATTTSEPAPPTTVKTEPSTTIGRPEPGSGGNDGPPAGATEPPATEPAGDGGGTGGGVVTPPTEHHGDGDTNNPQSLTIECERAQTPNRITCHWTPSTSPDHDKYVLLRITTIDGPGRVLLESADALEFVDTTVESGVGYGYRAISLRSDGTVEAHSNVATIMCCGDVGGGDGGGTPTPTTAPHENTTTTTEHHDGTTTTTTSH